MTDFVLNSTAGAAGLTVTTVAGLLTVGPFLRWIDSLLVVNQPPGVEMDIWRRATKLPSGVNYGSVIGFLERILFFLSLWVGQFELVAGWLAFKVAAKWETWAHIVRVPDDFTGNKLEDLRARHELGSRQLARFLIGPLCNFLWAFVGVGIGKAILKFIGFH